MPSRGIARTSSGRLTHPVAQLESAPISSAAIAIKLARLQTRRMCVDEVLLPPSVLPKPPEQTHPGALSYIEKSTSVRPSKSLAIGEEFICEPWTVNFLYLAVA